MSVEAIMDIVIVGVIISLVIAIYILVKVNSKKKQE